MPTKKRKSFAHSPDVRSIKIQPRLRINRYSERQVPEIRLSGCWLEKLGFQSGQQLSVITMPGKLIIHISLEDENSPINL